MTEHVIIRRGAYYDSVTLMLVSRAAATATGDEVSVGMATPLNLELLANQGFTIEDAGPNDLVIAIRSDDVEAAVQAVDDELARKGGGEATARERPAARSLAAAARRDDELSMAFLSIPGDHVAHEAAAALEAGLHVFCFSDGVSLEVEAALKRRALERDLLFLGADCGTAIIDGVALGFANAVRARAGRHRRRVRDRDAGGLLPARRGRDRRRARDRRRRPRPPLERRRADDAARARAARAGSRHAGDRRDLQAARPGGRRLDQGGRGGHRQARRARLRPHARGGGGAGGGTGRRRAPAARGAPQATASQGEVRGLYSGGTLCGEAERIVGHGTFTDFGDDEYTQGRAHPMIDQSLRLEHLAAAAEPVLLLDVVLGYGAHPDPASELAPVIAGKDAHVIVALCGAARIRRGSTGSGRNSRRPAPS